jgi:hypothetical protein
VVKIISNPKTGIWAVLTRIKPDLCQQPPCQSGLMQPASWRGFTWILRGFSPTDKRPVNPPVEIKTYRQLATRGFGGEI